MGCSLMNQAGSTELAPSGIDWHPLSDHIAPGCGRCTGTGPTAVDQCLSEISMTATAAILRHSGVTAPASIPFLANPSASPDDWYTHDGQLTGLRDDRDGAIPPI